MIYCIFGWHSKLNPYHFFRLNFLILYLLLAILIQQCKLEKFCNYRENHVITERILSNGYFTCKYSTFAKDTFKMFLFDYFNRQRFTKNKEMKNSLLLLFSYFCDTLMQNFSKINFVTSE